MDVHGATCHVLVVVLALVSLMAQANSAASSETGPPVEMAKERHHRLLPDNAEVCVFAVTIPHHEEAYVQHENNLLTVALKDNEVICWRPGQSPMQHLQTALGDVRFLSGGTAGGMRNDSNSEYRNITLEFRDPRVTKYGYRADTAKWDHGPAVMDLPVDPHARFVQLTGSREGSRERRSTFA
jgi:hypothetical protein